MSYRVAVVGATGAVGTVMLAKLRERGFPAAEIVPFASERSAGRELDGVHRPAAHRRDDPGLRPRASSRAGATTSGEWAPRFVDAGAVVVDNSSAFRRDHEIPLVVSEVNPEALDGHQRPDRQPELLDDAADGRAQADPRRGRDRAPDRLDLPVGVGHRRQGGRGARGADARRRSHGEEPPAPDGLPAPDRVQRARRRRQLRRRRRPHRRRAQDDVRDAQDPRRRGDRDRASPARACRCVNSPLGVGERADARAAQRRGARASCSRAMPGLVVVDDPATHGYPTALSARPAATRCSSAASAATRRTSAG